MSGAGGGKRRGGVAPLAAGVLMGLACAAPAVAQSGEAPSWWQQERVNAPASRDRAAERTEREAARLYADARADLEAQRTREGLRKLEILVASYPASALADVARRDLHRLYARLPMIGSVELAPVAIPLPRSDLTDGGAPTPRPEPPGSLLAVAGEDFRLNAGDRVFFAEGTHELGARARAALEAQAVWLQRHPMVEVMVEGHADERGTAEHNRDLSLRRADTVKARLVELGIAPGRIGTVGHGRERPLALCRDQLCAAQNRLAITVITRAVSAGGGPGGASGPPIR